MEEFCRVLKSEGVTVRRPEPIRWDQLGTFRTPYFEEGGYTNATPRDTLMVVGDEIIESATAWRSRLFEGYAYKKLFCEYFRQGAKWTAAPRPSMADDLYSKDFPMEYTAEREKMNYEGKFVLTETEPVFDGADTLRFGRDVYITPSNTTNHSGVEWLRRHLKSRGISVHSLVFKDWRNYHADATFLPLKPGVMLVNPERPCLRVNDVPVGWEHFTQRGWEIFEVPPSVVRGNMPFVHWLHMNLLSLDPERVVIQRGEEPLKRLLTKRLGLKTIEVDISQALALGGAFHCWTLDVRRRGTLEKYL